MKNNYVAFTFVLSLAIGISGCQSVGMSSSINELDVNQGSSNQVDMEQKSAVRKTPIHNQPQKIRCNC